MILKKKLPKTVAKMYKSSVPFSLTPRDGGARYSRPVQDCPYPRVGVDNHRQLEMSGVSSVAVLGTLPETAFSSPSIEIGQECLSCTSLCMMIRSEINVSKLIIICCSYFLQWVQLTQGFLKPFVLDSCSCVGTVVLRWSPGDSISHSLLSLYLR